MASDPSPISLLHFCDELLLHVLAYLEIPELLACSRTCHHLRSLAADPILHRNRLLDASYRLSLSLSHRPTLSFLRPPTSAIYLTPTLVAARKISRSLISIRLSRSLSKRPSVSRLVESNILPEECWGPSGPRCISPGLVGVKRGLERERVKDGLRGWLKGRKREEMERRMREGELGEVKSVKGMARRFAVGRETGENRWGSGAGEKRKRGDRNPNPTRAHVLGLRKFWEGVGKAQAVS